MKESDLVLTLTIRPTDTQKGKTAGRHRTALSPFFDSGETKADKRASARQPREAAVDTLGDPGLLNHQHRRAPGQTDRKPMP
jgi:hypothetical protein